MMDIRMAPSERTRSRTSVPALATAWLPVVFALVLALSPDARAGVRSSGSNLSGPDDDLGTLPSTSSGGLAPGMTPGKSDEDLGTLPSVRETPVGPTLTVTGSAGQVELALRGLSGPAGGVTLRPGPEGELTAVLEGDFRLALLASDPRLAGLSFVVENGSFPGLGQLSYRGLDVGSFPVAAFGSLELPVAVLHEPFSLGILTRGGDPYGLQVRVDGSFVVLSQDQ